MYDKNQAKEELKDILNQKEYQIYYEDNRNFLEIWWDNVKSWVGDFLKNLFDSIEPSGSGFGGIVLLIGIVAAVVLLVFLVGRNYHRKRKFRDTKPLQSTSEVNWSYHNHLSEAQKQESKNQYSIASRHLFLALLLYFDDKEWLEARLWKTNWEYYEELRKDSKNRANQFFNLAQVFDEIAYGERDITQDAFLEYKDKIMNSLETNLQLGGKVE